MKSELATPPIAETRSPARPTPWRRFINTPKGLVLIVLLAVTVIGAIHPSDRASVIGVVVASLTGVIVDYIVASSRGWKRRFSDGGLVTGIIIGLILSSATPWYVTALTAAIAAVSKHVLKSGRKPLLNPAAVGLLVTVLIFQTGQSWWGDLADLPVWCVVFLLVGGYVVTQRVNKFPQVLSYLGTYFLLLFFAGFMNIGSAAFSPGDALRNPLVNAALFLAFFMLTDPPTSPGNYHDQVVFGIIAAVVSVATYLAIGGLSYLLIGLLVANAWKAWSSRSGATKSRQRTLAKDEFY